ncbi:hypothetical protein R1flu_003277 [Riccia fluitans]|uniref:Fatty acyl-CoA reductase n=1 Tax=Riccia fluitans TaxID=41844 RepID=A0ABD1YC07_9MARC
MWQTALTASLQAKSEAKAAGSDFSSGTHDVQLQRLEMRPLSVDDVNVETKGLHIVQTLKYKRILITGSTGFLAKVLVEKVLRNQPRIGQVYLLLRAGRYNSIQERTVDEIFDCSLFKPLREKYGDEKYVELVGSKVTCVSGDIGKQSLGLSSADGHLLKTTLDVIISSAATTKFDERYDHAVNINTVGPLRLLEFAKQCTKLALFAHVSTAYANGKRKGFCPEVPFEYGQSLQQEIHQDEANLAAAGISTPEFDPGSEIELAFSTADKLKRMYASDDGYSPKEIIKGMVKLGSERAQMFGWTDTYTLTKAMGEQMLMKHKGDHDVPVVIIRPSIVESTIRSPFDGWIQGNRMLDPIILAYGKGYLKGILGDPDNVIDMIPADIVVNVLLAAIVKHGGYKLRKPIVYQVASSVVNPMMGMTFRDALYDHFRKHPMASKHDSLRLVRVKYLLVVKNEAMFWFLLNALFNMPLKALRSPLWVNNGMIRKTRTTLKRNFESVKNMAVTYRPYIFYEGRFDASNSERLLSEISDEEKDLFGYMIKDVNWDTYLKKVHIPGLRQHVLGWRQTGTFDPNWTIIDPVPERYLPRS